MNPPDLVRLARRVMMTVMRGRVKLVDDTGAIQTMQLDLGPSGPAGSLGIRDKTKVVNFFGFSANPPADGDAIVLNVGGDRNFAIVIGHNHQKYRLTGLQPGEAALYDQWGNIVKMTNAGIVITHATKVTVTAPQVTVQSNSVDLGAPGGPAVARVGDTVNLTTGVITSGSAKVRAA